MLTVDAFGVTHLDRSQSRRHHGAQGLRDWPSRSSHVRACLSTQQVSNPDEACVPLESEPGDPRGIDKEVPRCGTSSRGSPVFARSAAGPLGAMVCNVGDVDMVVWVRAEGADRTACRSIDDLQIIREIDGTVVEPNVVVRT